MLRAEQLHITFNPGNEPVALVLLGPNGATLATASNRKLSAGSLAPGQYVFRVSGSVAKPVDFTIRSTQR